MSNTERGVMIHTVPDHVSLAAEQALVRSLGQEISTGRPCFVLDCTAIREVTHATTHFLLSCLEEVLKNNGDLRLAALPHTAIDELHATGIDRLFEIYATVDEAVHSYRERACSMAPHLSINQANSKDAA